MVRHETSRARNHAEISGLGTDALWAVCATTMWVRASVADVPGLSIASRRTLYTIAGKNRLTCRSVFPPHSRSPSSTRICRSLSQTAFSVSP